EKDTFAIRVKRSGKHDYTSMDVAKIVGKTILDNFKNLDIKVNLSSPKKVIFIEIRDNFSYIFSEIIKSNWGGLPIETQKKIIVIDIGRLNDLVSGFLLMKRGSMIYPILFQMTEKPELFNIWLSNWKELTKFIPFYQFILKRVNLLEILKFVIKKIDNKKYICGICSLIRFDILSRIIESLYISSDIKVRAITEGISLNNSTFCPDQVELNSIALNYLFSNFPIFTPIIGLDLDEFNDLIKSISVNLKEFDYCELKPKEQDFNLKILKELYESLELDEKIQQAIQKIEEIKILE
ncbi:MAG: THUMP domain-containing protein, partial [Promethearchaeota archaeon]